MTTSVTVCSLMVWQVYARLRKSLMDVADEEQPLLPRRVLSVEYTQRIAAFMAEDQPFHCPKYGPW